MLASEACSRFPVTAAHNLYVGAAGRAVAHSAEVVGERLGDGRLRNVALVQRSPVVRDSVVRRIRDPIAVRIDPAGDSRVTAPQLQGRIFDEAAAYCPLHPDVGISDEVVSEDCTDLSIEHFLIRDPPLRLIGASESFASTLVGNCIPVGDEGATTDRVGEDMELGDLVAGTERRRRQVREEIISSDDVPHENLVATIGGPQRAGETRGEYLEVPEVMTVPVDDLSYPSHRSIFGTPWAEFLTREPKSLSSRSHCRVATVCLSLSPAAGAPRAAPGCRTRRRRPTRSAISLGFVEAPLTAALGRKGPPALYEPLATAGAGRAAEEATPPGEETVPVLSVNLPERRMVYRGVDIPTRPPRHLQHQPLLALAVLAEHAGQPVTVAAVAEQVQRVGGLVRRLVAPEARDLRYKLLLPFRHALKAKIPPEEMLAS